MHEQYHRKQQMPHLSQSIKILFKLSLIKLQKLLNPPYQSALQVKMASMAPLEHQEPMERMETMELTVQTERMES
jgi:hypothetical protein